MENLRRIAGDEIVRDLERGAEAHVPMWECATEVFERRCHDADELGSDDGPGAVGVGMTAADAVRRSGGRLAD